MELEEGGQVAFECGTEFFSGTLDFEFESL